MAKDASLEDKVGRITRQEQVIAHLAANGLSTALAEQRLAKLRRSLDAMLQRRRAKVAANPTGQLGPAGRDGQPGADAP